MKIERDVPLKPYTTFKIGGPARYFVNVHSEEELTEAYKFAKEKEVSIFVLGHGSNLLVSDEGFGGLVIQPHFKQLECRDESITAGSGVLMSDLVKLSSTRGLTGLEWAAGLPGGVGGAVVNNSGCNGGSMSDIVERVRFFDNKLTIIATNESSSFEYRSSYYKKYPHIIIIEAELKLKKGDPEEISKKIKNFVKNRALTQPKGQTIGCIFKNPLVAGRLVSAGMLIDNAGLKGLRFGNAQISLKHGNFFLNLRESATAFQMMELIDIAQRRVYDAFGIELEKEICCLGNFSKPH